jgi:hypothetical protein
VNDRLIKLAVIVVVPTMACFGYYTLDALPPARTGWAIPAVLAYPACVIGGVGLVCALRAPRRSPSVLALWALCVALPGALLFWLRG